MFESQTQLQRTIINYKKFGFSSHILNTTASSLHARARSGGVLTAVQRDHDTAGDEAAGERAPAETERVAPGKVLLLCGTVARLDIGEETHSDDDEESCA